MTNHVSGQSVTNVRLQIDVSHDVMSIKTLLINYSTAKTEKKMVLDVINRFPMDDDDFDGNGPNGVTSSGYGPSTALTSVGAGTAHRRSARLNAAPGSTGYGGIRTPAAGASGQDDEKPLGFFAALSKRSLFIFSEENFIRKYAKLIIEWGYPLCHMFVQCYERFACHVGVSIC